MIKNVRTVRNVRASKMWGEFEVRPPVLARFHCKLTHCTEMKTVGFGMQPKLEFDNNSGGDWLSGTLRSFFYQIEKAWLFLERMEKSRQFIGVVSFSANFLML